jgi:hypothetical protein
MMLHPDPYPNRESCCEARLKESERRLSALSPDMKTVKKARAELRQLRHISRPRQFSVAPSARPSSSAAAK